jgi:predicted outer membrane repeat protein
MRRIIGLAAACSLLLSSTLIDAAAATGTTVDCRAGGDLQAALDSAGPDATLSIVGTCVGNFVVTTDVTLVGRPGKSILDGAGLGATLLISNQPITVTIAGLRIAGGYPGLQVGEPASVIVERSRIAGNPGNGIEQGPWSQMTLRTSTIQANGMDGAFVVGPSASLTVERSTVSDNAGSGVALAMQSVVQLNQSTVTRNGGRGILATNASVGLSGSTVSANGGGLSADSLSYVRIQGSAVVRNSVDTFGGGLYVEREIWPSGGLTIEDSRIAGNVAGISGGGLYVRLAENASATLTDVLFVANTAGVSGGGIYREGGGTLNLTDVTFRGNAPNACTGC